MVGRARPLNRRLARLGLESAVMHWLGRLCLERERLTQQQLRGALEAFEQLPTEPDRPLTPRSSAPWRNRPGGRKVELGPPEGTRAGPLRTEAFPNEAPLRRGLCLRAEHPSNRWRTPTTRPTVGGLQTKYLLGRKGRAQSRPL